MFISAKYVSAPIASAQIALLTVKGFCAAVGWPLSWWIVFSPMLVVVLIAVVFWTVMGLLYKRFGA